MKSPVFHGALLVLPFILLFGALVLATMWGWEYIREEYPAVSLLVRPQRQASAVPDLPLMVPPETSVETDEEGETKEPEEVFYPMVQLGDQWATMTVDGWEKKDIPVIWGDGKSNLRDGAGTWAGSRFCGQDGKLVLCAHVTTWFYELEDTKVGDKVTFETYYGTYVYEVTETLVFERTDPTVLKNTDGEETLVLYTCYPRSVGFRYTSQRYAVICKLVEGKTWIER